MKEMRDFLFPVHGKKELLLSFCFLFSSVISGIVLSFLWGGSLWEIYLAGGMENDELGYFNQVAAVLEYGMPQGYHGYNETHAPYLTFASWGPVVLLPYVLWGLVFGWTVQSPFFCHVTMITLSSWVFLRLAKPNFRQTTFLFLFTQVFFAYQRYIFSGMIEATYFSLIWILAGTVFYLQKSKETDLFTFSFPKGKERLLQKSSFIFLFQIFIISYLTLLRPYYGIYMVFPLVFIWKEKKIKKLYGWIFLIPFALLVNFWISNHLCAQYYIDSSYGIIGGNVAELGLLGSIFQLIAKIPLGFLQIIQYAVVSPFHFNPSVYYIFLLQVTLPVILLLWQRKQWKKILPECLFPFCGMVIVLATVLLYRLDPGMRGMISSVLLLGIGFSMSQFRLLGGMNLLLVLFFSGGVLLNPVQTYHKFIFQTEETEKRETHYTETFLDIMGEATSNDPWDNTLLYYYIDIIPEVGVVATNYVPLFFLPTGYGINTWTDWDFTPISMMKSKWLMIPSGGETEKSFQEILETMPEENRVREMYRDDTLILYATR